MAEDVDLDHNELSGSVCLGMFPGMLFSVTEPQVESIRVVVQLDRVSQSTHVVRDLKQR